VPYAEIEHKPSLLNVTGCLESYIPYGNINTLPWGFTPYSKSLLITGKTLLDLHGLKLVAFHWRRGDQLRSRCLHSDKSLNCDTVDEFIDDVETRVALYESEQGLEDIRVYIATDEDHPEALQRFDDMGYKYSKRLVTEASKQNVTLTSADSILIDIMLMCLADSFVYYGYSSVNFVASDCRTRKLL
jgi:hypothetical protein